ncbi:segregation/condensation protein A, partial [bacterium]|nr:segregation/condensation protein A [bacterium]
LIDPAGEIGHEQISLTEKLTLYAAVVEASEWLQNRESLSLLRYNRQNVDDSFELPVELDVSLESLAAVYRRLYKRKVVSETPIKIKKVTISVPERIEELKRELKSGQVADFVELLHFGDIPDIVVTFLSLLELVREHKLSLQQDGTLGKIRVAVF